VFVFCEDQRERERRHFIASERERKSRLV
jgi:hypothetical protein